MFIRYKKTHGKIAMGLLALNPDEKDLTKLLETINDYESNPDWQLYLWKEGDRFIGLMGIIIDENIMILNHLSVLPSYREQGYGTRMLSALMEQYPDKTIRANENTAAFVDKFYLNNTLRPDKIISLAE